MRLPELLFIKYRNIICIANFGLWTKLYVLMVVHSRSVHYIYFIYFLSPHHQAMPSNQQQSGVQQPTVHFASPLQKVYNLSPISSATTDPRLNQMPNANNGLNPNAAPFNSLWNRAVANFSEEPNFPAASAFQPPPSHRSGSISLP